MVGWGASTLRQAQGERGITPILAFPHQGGRDKRGWIPACAGMTHISNPSDSSRRWIPACAGMTVGQMGRVPTRDVPTKRFSMRGVGLGVGEEASVEVYGLAGGEVAGVGGHVDHQGGDLLGEAAPLEGDVALE